MKKNIIIKVNVGDWVSYLDNNCNLQITEVLRDYIFHIGDPVDCSYKNCIITKDGTIKIDQLLDIQRVENREVLYEK